VVAGEVGPGSTTSDTSVAVPLVTVNGRPTVSDAMLIDVSNAPVLSKQ
jgi:hypothetical protein